MGVRIPPSAPFGPARACEPRAGSGAQVSSGFIRNTVVLPAPGQATTRWPLTLWKAVAALAVLAIGAHFLLAVKHSKALRDRFPAPPGPYVLDSRIRAAGAAIWLTPDQLSALHVQFDSPWPAGDQAVGVYIDDVRTIIIRPDYRNVAPWQLETVIAYEYMHFVWSHRSHPAALTSWLNQIVLTYPAAKHILDETLQVDGGAEDRWTELLSIACTETQDAHMAPQLVAYCDQELPGRRNLPAMHFVY